MIIKPVYIEKLKEHNDEAFDYIYQMTKKGVYAVIFSIVRDYDETEDIMQDVYMKMIRSLHQYQPNTNFYNWLLQIARHSAIDYYRRKSKETTYQAEDYDQTFQSKIPDPAETDAFESMMQILDEEERMVVLLKVIDQMKHREIAKLMNKPIGTILWIYQKAMKKLKEIGGYDDDQESNL